MHATPPALGPASAEADDAESAAQALDRVFLRLRPTAIAAQCCATRVNQLISPFWTDRTGVRRLLPLLYLGADVTQIGLLRNDPRLHLGTRLAADAAQIAVASLSAVRDDYDEAIVSLIPGCALAIEAGARRGASGFIVPLVNGAVYAGARRLRGHRIRPGIISWQIAAALGGLGLAQYGKRQRAAEFERHRRQLAARLHQAEIEGRNDLTNGIDALIDEVQRVGVLIDLSTGRPSSNVAGAWKARLGEEIRSEFVFLGDELMRLQAAFNAGPSLRRLVTFDVPEGVGTVILTRDEASQLSSSLGSFVEAGGALVGRHRVVVEELRRGLSIRVGDVVVELPRDQRGPALDFDPIPGGFGWSAVWLVAAGGTSRESVPRWGAFGPAGAAIAAGFATHRARLVDRATTRPVAVGASALLSLIATVIQTLTMRSPRGAGGVSRFPFTLALRGYGMVTLLARRHLTTTQRWGAVGAGGLIGATGWFLTPKPRSRREGVADLVWPVQSVMLAGAIAAGIDEDAARLGARVREADDAALGRARSVGRLDTMRFAERCVAEARAALSSVSAELDEDLRVECERRLAACEARLTKLG
jgi:hypothetical protein